MGSWRRFFNNIGICWLILASLSTACYAYCFEEAGEYYGISPAILWSIAKVESDFNPAALNKNKNGSYDIGVMQINSCWRTKLDKELWQNIWDPCTNVYIGAWVLAQCVSKHGYTWEAVGCYNAQGKDKRSAYAKKIYVILKKNKYVN